MSKTQQYPLRCTQVLMIVLFMWAAPIFADSVRDTEPGVSSSRAHVHSGSNRLGSQHSRAGTGDGVVVLSDGPTRHHVVRHRIGRPGPRHPSAARGRSVIIRSPARVHPGHCYRSPRVYSRYRTPARWVPGHWTWVSRRVWIPGRSEQRRVPAVYRREIHDGREILVLEREERRERVWIPGRYETRRQRVWVEGYWTRY